jgi:co-chaperonin GroES (HSP10)
MKIVPLETYCLIEPVVKERTKSGIILPDKAKQERVIGRVAAVSEFCSKLLKQGDKVVYKEWGTNTFDWEGKKYYLIKLEDILARIDPCPTDCNHKWHTTLTKGETE